MENGKRETHRDSRRPLNQCFHEQKSVFMFKKLDTMQSELKTPNITNPFVILLKSVTWWLKNNFFAY